MTAASGLAPPPGAAPPPAGACRPAAGPSPATSSRCGRDDRVFADAQAPPPPPPFSLRSRAPVRARASVVRIAELCASRRTSSLCPEPRCFPGKRGSPKSAVLGPCRLSGLTARLLAWPGRRCGGVRLRRPSAWSGGSPAACGSPPPPPPSHPSCGGARPPRRFCRNKGGPRGGAGAAPPAVRSAPARGGR